LLPAVKDKLSFFQLFGVICMHLRSYAVAVRMAFIACLTALSVPCMATIFSSLHGVVHDAQHFPVSGAEISLRAVNSDFELKTTSNTQGLFDLANVPLGVYRVRVEAPGFAAQEEVATIQSGTHPILHFALAIATVKTVVTVDAPLAQADSVTPTTMLSRAEIDETPGAMRTNSFAVVTNYVPGAYITHDMLHMRGGHQTGWLIDGVSIPNTNIGSNVGPQIDPKDMEALETQRGSYPADEGDRTYGIFNVLPRNGFERDREAELIVSGGNFQTGSAQLSLGDHTANAAWYASLAGSRSTYGLQTPTAETFHDATNSQSGFGSLLVNHGQKDQFRLVGQLRQDYFQVPYDPDPDSWENQNYNSSGLRDGQTERDAFLLATWVRTLQGRTTFELSPFYHLNTANYDSKASDFPVASTWDRTSNYLGLQANVRGEWRNHNLAGGTYIWGQHDSNIFGAIFNDGSSADFRKPVSATGALMEAYVSDNWQATNWLSLMAGMRFQSFQGDVVENYADPRFGAAVTVPVLHWVLRGFYGRFYQAPPLLSVSGPVIEFANENNTTFVPLYGERDEEHQFGIQIPYKGWVLDVDNFKTRINNFLDHSNLGESNIYFPVTVDGALVRAWEATVRSPQLKKFGRFHLAYSNQIAEQRGNITGGLICAPASSPECDAGFDYEPVDHDQRNTLNTGFTTYLPFRSWFSTNVYYGSGFSNGLAGDPENGSPYQGAYLPAHTTFDVAAGAELGENWKIAINVVNVTNHRVLEDNSLTIGGFHWNDPRLISAEVRYRFHF
jgi:TonB dependent receptor/Carboxypeptidase regulatory-like domain/TonB-dependent Receptor Plug Domain